LLIVRLQIVVDGLRRFDIPSIQNSLILNVDNIGRFWWWETRIHLELLSNFNRSNISIDRCSNSTSSSTRIISIIIISIHAAFFFPFSVQPLYFYVNLFTDMLLSYYRFLVFYFICNYMFFRFFIESQQKFKIFIYFCFFKQFYPSLEMIVTHIF
jgi:hypothetical protein